MKSLLFSILLFLMFLSFGHLNALELYPMKEQNIGGELIAIDIQDLEVSEEGIFVNIDGNWIELLFVARDSSGRFLGQLQTISERGPETTWPCPHCGTSNEFWRRVCKSCGKHPMSPR